MKAPEIIYIDKADDYDLIIEAWPKLMHTINNDEIEYILKSKADEEIEARNTLYRSYRKASNEDYEEVKGRLIALKKEREELKEYAWHKRSCDPKLTGDCTCGLDKLLNQ